MCCRVRCAAERKSRFRGRGRARAARGIECGKVRPMRKKASGVALRCGQVSLCMQFVRSARDFSTVGGWWFVPFLMAEFEGAWVEKGVEGDLNAVMRALGQGWVVRKAAAAAGWGAGKTRQTISFAAKAKGSSQPAVLTVIKGPITRAMNMAAAEDGAKEKPKGEGAGQGAAAPSRAPERNRLEYVLDGETETPIECGYHTAEETYEGILVTMTLWGASGPATTGTALRFLRGKDMCVRISVGGLSATRVFGSVPS